MSNDKLRRQITCEAARLLYVRQESEYYRAKLVAARRIGHGWVKAADLPTNREVRDEIQVLARLHEGVAPTPDDAADLPAESGEWSLDRFAVYRALLAPLETVRQDPERHPEGDALYHSLQVFELARDAVPYDEEFQLAALLHDVGKGLDPRNHIAAALEALSGHITERTRWLIEHHPDAQALRDGTLGMRARRRLEAHEDFDDLMLLCDCDRRGRARGAQVPDVEDAIEHLRELAQSDDGH
ncbi:MAG: HD domain-containing protein [Pirellulales bacterium]